jgi:hypothetical protein
VRPTDERELDEKDTVTSSQLILVSVTSSLVTVIAMLLVAGLRRRSYRKKDPPG